MPHVEVHTRPLCIWCLRAKLTLRWAGIPFVEHDASTPEQRAALAARTGRKTVPQIFVDGRPIGGSDELAALVRSGGLSRPAGDVG